MNIRYGTIYLGRSIICNNFQTESLIAVGLSSTMMCPPPEVVCVWESAHVHAENEDIDPVIALAGDGIEGRLRAAGLLRVPRPNPWLHAVSKFRNDAVREFLHRIAGRGVALEPRVPDCVCLRCPHVLPLSV